MRINNDLGAVINHFLPALLQKRGLTSHQLKVLRALSTCRTTKLGGSAMVCHDCGNLHYVLHSCRNRHCPRCQGIFSKDPKLMGAQPGAIAVLHTWDQQLGFHPHVHMIIPAGGIDKQGCWKSTKQEGDFLFDVKQLSEVFSARFARKLRRLKRQGKIKKFVPRDLIKKPWVVYAKQAFGSPESVVEYLGRYSHRVAISNHRILKVTSTHVTFSWINRKAGYLKETKRLTGVEFLELFLEHIVPPSFQRIRHMGFLSYRNKRESIEKIREQLLRDYVTRPRLSRAEVLTLRFGERSVLQCRECGGELLLLESYPKERAPPEYRCA